MKYHRGIYTISLVFLVTFVGFLNIGLTPIITQEEDSRRQVIFDAAVSLANPPSDAVLVRFDKDYDYERNDVVWFLEWKTKNKLISVEVDDSSLEILYYIDTSQTSQQKVGDITENNKLIVLNKAKQLLASMESYGIQTLPNDTHILCIEIMSGDWVVVWGHEIDSVLIEGDEISVTMNRDCNEILSYRKVWNNIQIDTTPSLSLEEANQIVYSLCPPEILLTHSKLLIIDANKTNMNEKDYCLAYEVTTTNTYGKTIIFRINANTGTLVEYDINMYGWNYQDVYVKTDFWFPGQYDTSYKIFRRLESSTKAPYTRFHVDATTTEEMALMPYCKLFFHMGHGYFIETGGEYHSTIITEDGYIAPSHILPKASTMNQLIFLGSCFSFGGTVNIWPIWPFEIDIDYSVGEAFLDAGSKCVFGWIGVVTLSQDWKFSKYFFDKAVNGYDFQSCFDYAKGKIWPEDRLKAKIDGDTSLSLTEDDAGGDASPGTYLGSGGDIVLNIYDEGLWGLGLDYDWFNFIPSGTRSIEIYVRPIDILLDVEFKVYDMNMILKYTINSAGYGDTEFVWFVGTGKYYVKVYAVGDSSTTHGGAYDLEIRILS